MNMIVLTQDTTFLLGPIAKLLGIIMNGIFNVLDFIGIPNVGLSIILFTIVIYLLMLPLTIKQQKFSKLSAKMNPELQAVTAKYKNKKDNDSMMKMNAETQAIYAKYGVSPTGSCVQLIIQMPILLSLYRVIQAMPSYVTSIKNTFGVLAENIISMDKAEFLQNSGIDTISNTVSMYGKNLSDTNMYNGIIDVLNKLSTKDIALISEHYNLTELTYGGKLILSNDVTQGLIDIYNNFLFLNMGDSPSSMVKEALANGAWLMVIAAFAIPVFSALTQWINVKLMPQQAAATNGSDQMSSMASSMKMMNMMMPIMSAFFCYSLPAGMGLYWISGSVVRSIQQIIINRHMDKVDLNALIEKNKEKSSKKMAKVEAKQKKYAEYAAVNTKSISAKEIYTQKVKEVTEKSNNNEATVSSKSTSNAKPGSLMSKANMVKDYNERNNK